MDFSDAERWPDISRKEPTSKTFFGQKMSKVTIVVKRTEVLTGVVNGFAFEGFLQELSISFAAFRARHFGINVKVSENCSVNTTIKGVLLNFPLDIGGILEVERFREEREQLLNQNRQRANSDKMECKESK